WARWGKAPQASICAASAPMALPTPGAPRPMGSPGVGLRRGASGAGEDVVELLHRVGVELDLERAQGACELLLGARADDGGRDRGVRDEPRDRDVRGLLAQVLAEGFVALHVSETVFGGLGTGRARRALAIIHVHVVD